MDLQYPESWASLRYPNQRAELLAYLKEGCEPSHYLDVDEVHFDVHFYFDDHDFADDPKGMVGLVLLDDTEVEAMTALVTAYAAAIGPGRTMPDVADVDWRPVVAASSRALACMIKAGESTYTKDLC